MRIKARFCVDPACVGIHDDAAPEVRFEVTRAFYPGKRPSLTLAIECIPHVIAETEAPPACSDRQRGGEHHPEMQRRRLP